MNLLVVGLWTANIIVDCSGQLAFKAAASDPRAGEGLARWRYMATKPWIWIGIGSYVAEFLVWLAFLSLVPLSDGVLLGSINIVAILLLGRVLFREKLTPLRIIGVTLISLGVAVVGLHG
ncbi:EamA family transporter [Brevundimonas diminuta]|uniref:EamA family transporter n=1 Tax=Brevundimonas diminuta TaxID=293 RepID=UPI003CFD0A89